MMFKKPLTFDLLTVLATTIDTKKYMMNLIRNMREISISFDVKVCMASTVERLAAAENNKAGIKINLGRLRDFLTAKAFAKKQISSAATRMSVIVKADSVKIGTRTS